MISLEQALDAHAQRFRSERGSGLSAAVEQASDRAIERLIHWSASKSRALTDRGPEGKDPAFGVAPAGGYATVWRIYPRKPEGGKVTLVSKAEHLLTPSEWKRMVDVLIQLNPSHTIVRGQRLDIGLPRIASDSQWALYAPLLDSALAVAQRHRP